MKILLIGFLGVLGVTLRYWVDQMFLESSIPYSTFIINIVGSFAIGYLFSSQYISNGDLKVALTVGLLGGFTTFSAYSLQVVMLFETNQGGSALLYAFGSPALGILSAWIGLRLGV